MTERELKLLINAQAVRRVQVLHAVMAAGYMVIVDGSPLETGRRKPREFRTLDAAAKLLFKMGVSGFTVKLDTSP
jgi:hypothetical protein